jgi:hypothetical protein
VIEGMGPVQYARTETIESLRAARTDVGHRAVLVSARDPALVADVDGIGRNAGTRVVVKDGEAIAITERDGLVIRTLRELDAREQDEVVDAVRALARLPAVLRPFRALAIEQVDDRDARTSALADALTRAGFESDGGRMVLASFRG